jgi:hypothetical protein
MRSVSLKKIQKQNNEHILNNKLKQMEETSSIRLIFCFLFFFFPNK